jgi:radical SAM superfamily enzyme YgiQ (UPF0313 family)
MPEDLFKRAGEGLDFSFVGEAEIGFPRLLDGLDHGRRNLSGIPGLVWRENGRIRSNPPVFPEDMDALGMPAWDLIHPETYPESQHGAFYQKFPIAPIMVTRGCPYPAPSAPTLPRFRELQDAPGHKENCRMSTGRISIS